MAAVALPDDIKELIALVRAGRLFDVQRWIAEGKRHIPPRPYRKSPLRAAVETGFHSMVEVLLKAGQDADHLEEIFKYEVAYNPRFDIVKLFMENGADLEWAHKYSLFRTFDENLMSYLIEAGVDPTRDDLFSQALDPPNKVQLKIYLRYKDKIPGLARQLNLALKEQAKEGNLKAVCLLMWAGADPHARISDSASGDDDGETSFEVALRSGHVEVAEKMSGKLNRAQLGKALAAACRGANISEMQKLLDQGADPNSGGTFEPMDTLLWEVVFVLWHPSFSGADWKLQNAIAAMVYLAGKGAKVGPDSDPLKRLRMAICKLDDDYKRLIDLIVPALESVLGPERFEKFAATQKFQGVLACMFARQARAAAFAQPRAS